MKHRADEVRCGAKDGRKARWCGMNKDLFEMFNTNSFVVGYGPRGIITLGDRIDEIVKESEIVKEATIEDLKEEGFCRLLMELVKEGEAKIVWKEAISDEEDMVEVEWKGKRYTIHWAPGVGAIWLV